MVLAHTRRWWGAGNNPVYHSDQGKDSSHRAASEVETCWSRHGHEEELSWVGSPAHDGSLGVHHHSLSTQYCSWGR